MNDLSFLQQLIARWKAKSPLFFKVITTISGVTAFITGLPILFTDLGVTVPAALATFENKTIAVAAVVGGLIAKLTVATPMATDQVLSDINATGKSSSNASK